ncbi:MAG TPA: GHMP kinase, partial [Pirellulales bacterium]
AAAIDKYCYLSCRYLPPFFEHRTRLVYSKIENCKSVDDISHPSVREVLKFLSIDRGLEIHHDGDLPARSGMGSSSAFTVGLLNAMYALKGQMPSKRQLANESISIEQDRLKESVGSQDQVMAAYGGVRHVRFTPHGEIIARPLTVSHERITHLNDHLMLFYTGIKRTASDIAETYITNIDLRRRQLRLMKDLVDEGINILNSGSDLMEFGHLLHEAWQAKRSLSGKVSNPQVDGLMDQAMKAGALGGKLTGAGGGGFMLLFVPPDLRGAVAAALTKLIHVPFKFEFSGSQIIFFEPETDYSAEEQTRAGQHINEFCELEKLRAA